MTDPLVPIYAAAAAGVIAFIGTHVNSLRQTQLAKLELISMSIISAMNSHDMFFTSIATTLGDGELRTRGDSEVYCSPDGMFKVISDNKFNEVRLKTSNDLRTAKALATLYLPTINAAIDEMNALVDADLLEFFDSYKIVYPSRAERWISLMGRIHLKLRQRAHSLQAWYFPLPIDAD